MTAPAPSEKKTAQLTAYKVLKRIGSEYPVAEAATPTDNKETWQVVASIQARSAEAAIRAHIDKHASTDPADGTYAAVSARSFRPVTVKVETARVVKLG